MTTHSFFNEMISLRAHKLDHSLEEYGRILPHATLVKATTLYQLYKHNVYTTDGRLSLKEFFRVAGQYLYYDKYVCDHGTEYYYLVIWNKEHPIYQATEDLIVRRTEANAPETLTDFRYKEEL